VKKTEVPTVDVNKEEKTKKTEVKEEETEEDERPF
jgi:hypothetical protein